MATKTAKKRKKVAKTARKQPGKSGNGYQNGEKAEKGSQNRKKQSGKSENGYKNGGNRKKGSQNRKFRLETRELFGNKAKTGITWNRMKVKKRERFFAARETSGIYRTKENGTLIVPEE